MKRTHKIYLLSTILFLMLGAYSCTAYLDREPESIVAEGEAFKNFTNFQGFVEEMYNGIPDKLKHYWTTSWNWGDDEIMNTPADWHMVHQVDLGNFWGWQAGRLGQPGCWLDKPNANITSGNKFDHALWPHAWYCIRKANLGLENLDKLTEATKEEKPHCRTTLFLPCLVSF